jgi:hypothetical protein
LHLVGVIESSAARAMPWRERFPIGMAFCD